MVKNFPKDEIFGLTSQIKRSASSIGDCLAEGSARITAKDKAHFVSMSYASAMETINHIIGHMIWVIYQLMIIYFLDKSSTN
ncbi:four helix bundle protein [Pedobacter aquatilis]|uniref:four helix bundle protein n=1 Tax=Pedobacter aquatilis TaxID=351343 RepID=UPI0029313CC6|nr:four helix bundle protein [Pedobacter aquatilis]